MAAVGTHTAAAEAGGDRMAWWSLRWIADLLVLPCKPIILPLLLRPPAASSVTGTILCPQNGGAAASDRRVGLCFQEGPSAPPLLFLDLPFGTCELAGACRVALECERATSGVGPLLATRNWVVYCNGRRAGFGSRRSATEEEARALEVIGVVSAGAGILPGTVPDNGGGGGGGGAGFAYLRGRFERVVGSADSESYHLVNPSGCLGQELSFFFLRV